MRQEPARDCSGFRVKHRLGVFPRVSERGLASISYLKYLSYRDLTRR